MSYFLPAPTRDVAGAADVITAADLIGAGAISYAVPCAVSLPTGIPTGRAVTLYATADAVTLTFTPSGGESVSGSPAALDTNQAVRLLKTGSTTWRLLQSGAGGAVVGVRFLVEFTAGGATFQPQVTEDPAWATWADMGSAVAADTSVGTINASGLTIPAGAAALAPAGFPVYAACRISNPLTAIADFLDVQAGQWQLSASFTGAPSLANTCVGVGFCVLDPGTGIGQYGGLEKTAASFATRATANNTNLGSSAAFADFSAAMLSSRLTSEGLNSGSATGVRSAANDVTLALVNSFGATASLVFLVWGTRTGVTAADTTVLPTNMVLTASRLP